MKQETFEKKNNNLTTANLCTKPLTNANETNLPHQHIDQIA